MWGPVHKPVLHIHPTYLCNLSCPHCYSASSPNSKISLPINVVTAAIRDAADLGFEVVSVSGGEPLVYPELAKVLETARDARLSTGFITNGLLIRSARNARAVDLADVIGVSVDGSQETHQASRLSSSSWSSAISALDYLAGRQKNTAIVMTATHRNWYEADDLADLAVRHGASTLHIHPLELPASNDYKGTLTPLTDEDKCKLFLLTRYLAAKHHGQLQIQLDLVHSRWMRAAPQKFYLGEVPKRIGARELGILVIRADGTVAPISHDMPAALTLANLHTRGLREGITASANNVIESVFFASQLYPVHAIIRKFVGSMTRKLSVTSSQ